VVEKPMRERQSTLTFAAVLRAGLRLRLKRPRVAHRAASAIARRRKHAAQYVRVRPLLSRSR
jgi:hypothetical protein